jgi:RimJ/RimL family protein N-acetyltransferase
VTHSTAPVIETARLRLRAHVRDDFEACSAMWGDAEVARFIGGSPSTPQESWFRMLRYAGFWSLLGYGYWAVTDRVTGNYLGDAGFADFHRGLPELAGFPEIGWALVPSAWGRGIATEVVQAVVAWGDESLSQRVSEVRCIIDSGNVASRRVAAKAGFVALGEAALGESAVSVFSRRSRRG